MEIETWIDNKRDKAGKEFFDGVHIHFI